MSSQRIVVALSVAVVSVSAALATPATLSPPEHLREVVFAERSLNYDGHWYANFGYYADSTERKAHGSLGRLAKIDVSSGKVTVLLDDLEGAVRDPAVHYDGKTIVFSYRPGGTDYYHLYEIQSDGNGLRQLTDGPFDDIEPTWMPDDTLVFVSTRGKRWVQCWLTQVAIMHSCDRNGNNIRQISANIEHDNTPWPLPDGRILYMRWEYVDRSQVHYHHLWTVNPDGTGPMIYYGNLHPGVVMIDAKPIPDSESVLAIFSPGHGRKEHAGAIQIVTPKQGPDHEPSAVQITAENDFNYRDPYPITGDLFLAARQHQLVWVNRDGDHSELYRVQASRGEQEVWPHEPRPLVPRERERQIPSRVDQRQSSGRMFLADVNEGRKMKQLDKPITELLVIESLPKPINYTGGMEPLSYGGTFTLERLLGRVPVEPDGSAYFEVPALRSVFFIAVDEAGDSVKRMQSFTNVMPGETVGCIGCHEHRTQTPDLALTTAVPMALAREASVIEPIDGVPDVFDFPRDIQPILDRHCIECHQPDQRKAGILLTGDHGPLYSHSYYTLTYLGQFVDGRNDPKSNLQPYAIGAVASPLMEKLNGGHYGVQASADELSIVRYWIETGAPYPGTYAALGSGMIGGYHENEQVNHPGTDWPETKRAVAAIHHRCVSCHPKIPTSLSDNSDISFWRPDWADPNLKRTRHTVFNLTSPQQSLMLRAPLAKSAGGDGLCRDATRQSDDLAADSSDALDSGLFASQADPDYQAILSMIEAGRRSLGQRKRFDMPGFQPTQQYVREMKRFGILEPDFTVGSDPIDVYQTDRAYWKSLWHRPKSPAIEDSVTLVSVAAASDDRPTPRTPIGIVAADNGTLYVGESTSRTIAVVDVNSRKVISRISLPANPTGLAITPSGGLIVTAGQADGQLLRVDPSTGSVAVLTDDLHAPTAPVFDPKHEVIYVAERFRSRIVVLDGQGKLLDEIPVSREPCSMVMGSKGAVLVVAHELPVGRADRGYIAATVSLIDTDTRQVQHVTLPNGSGGLRDVCVDSEGRFAYVTHILARYRLPTMQLERGWINTNALSVIDLKAKRLVNTVLLDEIDRGAANPWGVACSSDGTMLCVAHAGTQELSVIDRHDLHRKLVDVGQGKAVTAVSDRPENVPNDLAFLVGSRHRVPLKGNGARSITVVGNIVLIGMVFTDELAIVDLASSVPQQIGAVDLGGPQERTVALQGEMYFHDASLCFQAWQSCASCHPSDGRADGLDWDLLNDGIGNPKNTKSLLLSHQTPPVMSTGVRADAETAVRSGLRHIQFALRPESEAQAIDEYLKSLQAVPSPHLESGQLSESATRGERLFESAGCLRCHSGPVMTSGKAFDVGTGRGPEQAQPFDTPSLVEVWRTAPYLHDGRAATIREVLREYNPADRHGVTSNLSDGQIDDLAQYVLSR